MSKETLRMMLDEWQRVFEERKMDVRTYTEKVRTAMEQFKEGIAA